MRSSESISKRFPAAAERMSLSAEISDDINDLALGLPIFREGALTVRPLPPAARNAFMASCAGLNPPQGDNVMSMYQREESA